MRIPVSTLIGSCLAIGILSSLTQPASAARLHNGWQYAIDPEYDSLGADSNGTIRAGGTSHEIYSLAIKDDPTTDSVWVGIKANLPLYGDFVPNELYRSELGDFPVPGGYIGWGDLFLDFKPTGSLKQHSDASSLYAIRFAPGNDSGAATLGVFEGVQAKSVASTNAGWWNLFYNNSYVVSQSTVSGKPPARMGDKTWNDSYFDGYTSPTFGTPGTQMVNVIKENTGKKIGEVAVLGRETLLTAGFDPGFLSSAGSQTFGFRFAKSLLPGGDFIATLLTECINDGIAMVGNLLVPPPPPPSPLAICPVEAGQLNALQPDRIENGVKIFDTAPSGQWYDPPGTMGFTYTATGDRTFTAIEGFPCGIAPDDPSVAEFSSFGVVIDGTVYGSYSPGDNIDFTTLFPDGVKSFTIVGLKESNWIPLTNEVNDPFALKLTFKDGTSGSTGGLEIKSIVNVQDLSDLKIPKPVGKIPTKDVADPKPGPITVEPLKDDNTGFKDAINKYQELVNKEGQLIDRPDAIKLDPSKLTLATDQIVKVFFLNEGAGKLNDLSFSTSNPLSASASAPRTIFDKISCRKGCEISEPNGNLNIGDWVSLGFFKAGTTFDFNLLAQNWNDAAIDRYGASAQLNPDKLDHLVAYQYEDRVILGFEDLFGLPKASGGRNEGSDRDFNDVVFVVDLSVLPSAAVPEPSTMAGVALAAGGWFGARRKFGKKK